MSTPQILTGTGAVYRSDGCCLSGERHYSFTVLPYEVPTFVASTSTRPASVACSVELHGSEPLELENEPLVVVTRDGYRIRFHIFDVSDTPPHTHTTIVDAWPEITGADVHVTIESRSAPVPVRP